MKLILAALLLDFAIAFKGSVDPGEILVKESINQYHKDKLEALAQDLGFLRQRRSLETGEFDAVSSDVRQTRTITAVKANSIRLDAPDDLPNRNATGRVEVFHNGEWGTICDRDWDLADAQVVCSNLGMIKAVHEARRAKYGEGDGKIWLSGVQCTGKEPELNKCEHKPYGEVPDECTHRNDAGVKCLHTGVPQILEVGCYKDKPERALRHLVANLRDEINWYNIRSMVTKCAERAHELGYNVFAIQFYGECWADKEGESRHDMYGKVELRPDAKHKCFEGVGQQWTNFVYRFAPWHDLGCWTDNPVDRTMEMIANFRLNIDWYNIRNTVYACYKEAKKAGKTYFAVQFFGECWASNNPTSYQKHGQSTFCWSGVGYQNTNYVYKVVR